MRCFLCGAKLSSTKAPNVCEAPCKLTVEDTPRRERHTEPALRDVIPLRVVTEELPKLEAHCSAIDRLTVYGVVLHEDHKRFVVYCSGRRGAERLVPKTWAGWPVTRRMGRPAEVTA